MFNDELICECSFCENSKIESSDKNCIGCLGEDYSKSKYLSINGIIYKKTYRHFNYRYFTPKNYKFIEEEEEEEEEDEFII